MSVDRKNFLRCSSFDGGESVASGVSLFSEDSSCLADREDLIESIEWLKRHLSESVMEFLLRQVGGDKEEERQVRERKLERSLSVENMATLQQTPARRVRRSKSLGDDDPLPGGPVKMPRSSTGSASSDSGEKRRGVQRAYSGVELSGDPKKFSAERRKKRLQKMERASQEIAGSSHHKKKMAELGVSSTHSTDSSSMGGGGRRSRSSSPGDGDKKATDNIPPAIRYDCALLMVDISGFTKLSTCLRIEDLSKTINTYFQMIVEEVQAYGGDIIKFAGDALFAEWHSSESVQFEEQPANATGAVRRGRRRRKSESPDSVINGNAESPGDKRRGSSVMEPSVAVWTAAACSAKIIEKCADYDVILPGKKEAVATLNVHCAVGYGEMVGVHVGDEKRKEYLILGQPIQQVADALDAGKSGEVFASPEAMEFMNEEGEGAVATTTNSKAGPTLIVSTSKLFNPKFNTIPRCSVSGMKRSASDGNRISMMTARSSNGTFGSFFDMSTTLEDWPIMAIQELHEEMLLYVHPVVAKSEQRKISGPSNNIKRTGREAMAERRIKKEAELRNVFTIFISPKIDTDNCFVPGSDFMKDIQVLILLNDIMKLVSRELQRYKGHLRQFIVDDKGVVLIANFGLRGSTFPQMVKALAIPFATNVRPLLLDELGVECKMGATCGQAYCGVVGGIDRHEYAILAPSVNLAARLMANSANRGFLVDDEVRKKAHGRKFTSLLSVQAKGYSRPVPIFEPMVYERKEWPDIAADKWTRNIIGRDEQLNAIIKATRDVYEHGVTKMLLVTGENGMGKSMVLAHSAQQTLDVCKELACSHLVLCLVCAEEDLFQPLSIVGPLVQDVLTYSKRNVNTVYKGLMADQSEQDMLRLVGACRKARVPPKYADMISSLVTDHVWPEGMEDAEVEMETPEVARYIVSILLKALMVFDVVFIALDDVSEMDELSWKVLELLYNHSCNIVLVCASRLASGEHIFVDNQFWNHLFSEAAEKGDFTHLELKSLTREQVREFIETILKSESGDKHLREVYFESGGIPKLACGILKKITNTKADLRVAARGGSSKRISTMVSAFRGNKPRSQPSQRLLSQRSLSQRSFRRQSAIVNQQEVQENVLQRMDKLSESSRTHVDLGAILGFTFQLRNIVQVMEVYRAVAEEDKADHADSVRQSLDDAVVHGILEIVDDYGSSDSDSDSYSSGSSSSSSLTAASTDSSSSSDGDDSCVSESMTSVDGVENVRYKFTHEIWRQNILGLSLGSWKRDMHRLITDTFESSLLSAESTYARESVLRQMFSYWKENVDSVVVTVLAIRMAKKLIEEHALYGISQKVYRRSIFMWQGEVNKMADITKSYILKGRCYMATLEAKKCMSSLEQAVNVHGQAKKLGQLKDESLTMALYCTMFYALRLREKRDKVHEKTVADTYVKAAEKRGDPLHSLQSLAIQAEMLANDGDYRGALAKCRELNEGYNVQEHSLRLYEYYGDDYCAQCIALSAQWYMQQSNPVRALSVCDLVVDTILPGLQSKNHSGLFLTAYPVMWVLKDEGKGSRACDAFKTYVVDKIKVPGASALEPIFNPVLYLLDMVGTNGGTGRLPEIDKWVLTKGTGKFPNLMNLYTGRMGRAADSLTAEICLVLIGFARIEKRYQFIRKGYQLARNAEHYTKGMEIAHKQVQPSYDKLAFSYRMIPKTAKRSYQ